MKEQGRLRKMLRDRLSGKERERERAKGVRERARVRARERERGVLFLSYC